MSPHRLATALLAAVLLAAPPARAQDEPHPIAAQVKAALKDPSRPFTMLVSLQVKPGQAGKLEAAFARAVKPSRKEKGCLAYDLSRDVRAADRYVVYERWHDLAALEAHLKSKHVTALLAELGDLLAEPPQLRVLVPVGE